MGLIWKKAFILGIPIFIITFIGSGMILSYTQIGYKITTGIILLLLLITYYLYGKTIWFTLQATRMGIGFID